MWYDIMLYFITCDVCIDLNAFSHFFVLVHKFLKRYCSPLDWPAAMCYGHFCECYFPAGRTWNNGQLSSKCASNISSWQLQSIFAFPTSIFHPPMNTYKFYYNFAFMHVISKYFSTTQIHYPTTPLSLYSCAVNVPTLNPLIGLARCLQLIFTPINSAVNFSHKRYNPLTHALTYTRPAEHTSCVAYDFSTNKF